LVGTPIGLSGLEPFGADDSGDPAPGPADKL
jgi:hypothetical protein